MPDSIRYLPEIEGQLRNPHYLAVFRNPVAVASSMQRYSNGMALELGLGRSLEYFNLIQAFVARTRDPVMLIDYEAALAAPTALVESLGNFLQLELGDEEIKQAATAEEWKHLVKAEHAIRDLTSRQRIVPSNRD